MNNQANQALPKLEKEFEVGDNKKYKVKAIVNNTVYGHKAKNHLLGLYYLIL